MPRRVGLQHTYDSGLYYYHVRNEPDGTEIMARRTPRGAEQYTWGWMTRAPHLFTAVSRTLMRHQKNKPHARRNCEFCKDPQQFKDYMKWIRSAEYTRLYYQG